MRRHRELPFGAEPTADGVRFRLWAPGTTVVSLRIEDVVSFAIPMLREVAACFSLTTAVARPGTRDCYVVEDKAVADPASRCPPVERVPLPPMSGGRLIYSSAEHEALAGAPLSATFFLLPPAPR